MQSALFGDGEFTWPFFEWFLWPPTFGDEKVTTWITWYIIQTYIKQQPSNHIHIITSLFWKNNIVHIEGFKTQPFGKFWRSSWKWQTDTSQETGK